MDRVCIHIGLSLFAIKRMCETQERCARCTLYHFCEDTNLNPREWKNELMPDAGLMWDLTEGKEK